MESKQWIRTSYRKTMYAVLFGGLLMSLSCFSEEDSIDYSKYGRRGERARRAWLQIPEKAYDPNTKAYCDALWMRVHEADCPELILKDRKQVITLEQADKEGWRIGESGQSGRDRCCFKGYRRKHPEKDIPDDARVVVRPWRGGQSLWCLAGCHRVVVRPEWVPMTKKEAENAGALPCAYCTERGPSLTTADMETLRARPVPPDFTAPEGWTHQPFAPDTRPSQQEIEMLIQQTLTFASGILEAPFEDPNASLEQFMGMRFFFPVGSWLNTYQAYRSTGDPRLLEALSVSARHYRDLCMTYPDVAQLKASDPEGMSFMYSMAVSARLTLQLARKYPDQVSAEEIEEAASFLRAIVNTLEPIVEGNENLDPEMGIPQALANDFRQRAFNRALNGIGTLAMATAALQDLQALQNTTAFQPQIDRYRKCIQAYLNNWKSAGSLSEEEGKTYFYYPYRAGRSRIVDGVKLFAGAEDQGHFGFSLNGTLLIHDATPELGADDDFMTAIANSVHHNSYTENGSIQSPAADRIQPQSRQDFRAPRDVFYVLEAFREGVIEGQNARLNANRKVERNSGYAARLKTFHAQYLKVLREDRSLIHLGERM